MSSHHPTGTQAGNVHCTGGVSAATVASPRDRLWVSKCPPAEDLVTRPRPPSPWERQWTYRPDGHIPRWAQSKAPANSLEAIVPC
eukprot:8085367-Pyramimonas_sp.AAC.1